MDEREIDDLKAEVHKIDPRPFWEDQFRQKFDKLRRNSKHLNAMEENELIGRLRKNVLVTTDHLLNAAISDGDPNYLLRVVRQVGRLTALEGPSVNVNLDASSDNLPDLSGMSMEQLESLANGQAIDVTPTPAAVKKEKLPALTKKSVGKGRAKKK